MRIVALLLVLACSADPAGPPAPENAPAGDPTPESVVFASSQVLVRLAPGVSIETVNGRYGTETLGSLEDDPVYLLRTPSGRTVLDLVPAMASDDDLEEAEPNYWLGHPEAQGTSSITFANTAVGPS